MDRARPLPKIPAAIAAAVLLAVPLTSAFEGLRTHPYADPIGKRTVCYGDTEVRMRVYSADECGAMLRSRLAKDYAPHLLNCIPQLASKPSEFAALLDASYNAGWLAVCNSNLAVNARKGAVGHVCAELASWYTTALDRRSGKRRTLPGLVRRRQAEAALCRKDAP